MSGGSWDYVYGRFEDVASRLLGSDCPHRRALGRRVMLFSEALHDIEWVDSCDHSPGDEIEAIRKALGDDAPRLVLAEAVTEAERKVEELRRCIAEARALLPSTELTP